MSFKHKRFTSIKTRIFVSYGSVILILIILASFLYYFTAYHSFIENYRNTSRQLSKIVSQQLDQYFDRLNDVQKKLLESNEIRDYVFENVARRDLPYDRQFQNLIYTIAGFDFPFYHMNILNLNNNTLVTFGNKYEPIFDYQITPDTYENLVEPALEMRGSKLIVAPGKGRFFTVEPEVDTISFVRAFPRYRDSLSDPKGIMELQVNLDTIDTLIDNILLSYDNKAENVFIYNEKGEPVFPADEPEDLTKHYLGIDTSKDTSFRNPSTGELEIITSYYSNNTGFTTLSITPVSSLAGNIRFFRNIGILIALVSLILLFFITYRLAKSISLPIIRLKDSISNLQLDSLSENIGYQPKSNLDELETLSKAYNHMQVRLKESLDDVVKERTLSIHSQIMALQAQMDSHFLYNTLTIISIIAEEHDDMQASEMCLKLTRMLRYITEDYSMTTTFEQELEHAHNYTDLMSIRFGDKISFEYETDPSLNELTIPRLLIQPLIENSVKYSRDGCQKLIISTRIWRDEDFWYSSIQDNGPGFSDAALEAVHQKIQKLSSQAEFPQISINGMGVANIYLRLRLFYGDHFEFQIENTEQGAFVKIGGLIRHEE